MPSNPDFFSNLEKLWVWSNHYFSKCITVVWESQWFFPDLKIQCSSYLASNKITISISTLNAFTLFGLLWSKNFYLIYENSLHHLVFTFWMKSRWFQNDYKNGSCVTMKITLVLCMNLNTQRTYHNEHKTIGLLSENWHDTYHRRSYTLKIVSKICKSKHF